MFRFLLPIERIALCGLILAFAIIGLTNVEQFYFPALQQDIFSFLGFGGIYLHALTFAIFAYLFSTIFRHSHDSAAERNRSEFKEILILLRILCAFFLCVFLYGNFKLWSHLLHDGTFDNAYAQVDHMFGWLITFLHKSSNFLHLSALPYSTLFLSLFLVILPLSSFLGMKHLQWITTACSVVLVLGGISYCIAPAYGPFIHLTDTPYSLRFHNTEQIMFDFTTLFKESAGGSYKPQDFASPLGAMPSLHVAFTALFWYYMHRLHIICGLLTLPIMLFITAFSILTQFHYVVDIPAGLLVTVIAILCTNRMEGQVIPIGWQQKKAPTKRKRRKK